MSEADDDRILQVSVRIIEAPMEIHAIDLRPSRDWSGPWTLTVGSVRYIGRPGYSLDVPPGAESLPSRTSPIAVDQVEPVLRRLVGLLLPANPPDTGGFDGQNFSVRFDRRSSYVVYHWWGRVPDAWAPLGEIVDHLLSLVDEPDWPRARPGSGPAPSP